MVRKTISRSLLAFTFCLTLPSAAEQDPPVVHSYDGPTYRHATIHLPLEGFSFERCESLSRTHLSSQKHYLLQIRFTTTPDLIHRSVTMSHIPYEMYRWMWDRSVVEPSAELLVVGHDAVLRYLGPDGTRSHRVLRGRDPLQLTVDNVLFSLDWLEYWSLGQNPAERGAHSGPAEELFVFSKAADPRSLKPETIERAYEVLKLYLRNTALSFHISESGWFPTHAQSPIRNRFSPNIRPPTRAEHDSEIASTCSPDQAPACRHRPSHRR